MCTLTLEQVTLLTVIEPNPGTEVVVAGVLAARPVVRGSVKAHVTAIHPRGNRLAKATQPLSLAELVDYFVELPLFSHINKPANFYLLPSRLQVYF